ncbi:PREDICTED: transmembrane protease serine 9-like [Vollenhovia emeryi]|uniref:transmembrane protease serine 9-like n=1 Tax=Vollenhovia emeryi TaxID=411798 RepID=UPI0005F4635A|nr:PREDICTED: transmembrane protease serine 9-like [Vollenhovia emeryi]
MPRTISYRGTNSGSSSTDRGWSNSGATLAFISPQRVPAIVHAPARMNTCGVYMPDSHVDTEHVSWHMPSPIHAKLEKQFSAVARVGTNQIPIGQLRVTLGEHNLRAPEVPAARHESVINAVLHPGHRCGKYVDDIALLELARPISWSESVKPACLPVATGKPGYSAFGGVEAVVAGWGWLGEDRSKYKRADVLQKVDVQVVTNSVCSEWYASQNKSISVGATQMCAGWEDGKKDSCWADSGGPLMVGSQPAGPLMVIGVVSTGIGCSRSRLPGIYVRVSDYVSWIKSIVWPIPFHCDELSRNKRKVIIM